MLILFCRRRHWLRFTRFADGLIKWHWKSCIILQRKYHETYRNSSQIHTYMSTQSYRFIKKDNTRTSSPARNVNIYYTYTTYFYLQCQAISRNLPWSFYLKQNLYASLCNLPPPTPLVQYSPGCALWPNTTPFLGVILANWERSHDKRPIYEYRTACWIYISS